MPIQSSNLVLVCAQELYCGEPNSNDDKQGTAFFNDPNLPMTVGVERCLWGQADKQRSHRRQLSTAPIPGKRTKRTTIAIDFTSRAESLPKGRRNFALK